MSLTEDWVQMRRQYERVIHGTGSSRPRWHQCVKTVDTALPALVSHLYIKHYFSTDIKQKASELIDNVKLEFKHTLTTRQAWLDRQTMDRALDNWRRVSSLAMANAFYNTVKNTVVIPAGILEGVFYHKDRPNYLNYGSIAKTAAHEIIHGFDSHGRHFDADGNVNYWWTGDTDRHYRHKAKCFVRQYGDYYVDHLGLGVNGARTQAENIADNGGIKLAFSAYERYVRVNGPEPGLPALPYTPEQLFWVSYGTHYCAKHNKESLKNLILNDSHTPKQYRINGALSNSHDFSRVFNCPLGSPMNSVHKCSVW
ncbi:unnamed protein product [Oppiella nova]|uniref:Peptidase M13 C-terminal domain-containing protein n=1 Tax=Oppiella nova TaxID=334625 RepID=A0A7R9LJT0_9ACAR|nr:unnamed protein product [Oppiella nova]CAG2163689.1 unnamed protein product [Oppiella nova]